VALFPAACFLVLLVFLVSLGLLALAVTKVVAPDGRGHARGPVGGCAAVLALFLLCGIAVAGLGATVIAIALGSMSEWNPIRRIEISRALPEGQDAPWEDERSAVSARFTVHGEAGDDLVELLEELLDEDLSERVSVQRLGAEGDGLSVYELRLPISQAELERFERDVRAELDGLGLRLPAHVDIEFEGAD
jgi:hypothetical protein